MPTVAMLRNKKGFSAGLVLFLGAVFFMITSLVAFTIRGEDDQMVSVATSYVSESRLNFIAQTMQSDYFNNFLQTEFEANVVDFLGQGPYRIDPRLSFKDNLGSQLECHLSTSASQIIAGDAGTVYAAAYSKLPSISCKPQELGGASAMVNIKEDEDGALELDSWSLGQRIFCEDTESMASNEIDLQARGYLLQSRAMLMFEKAVETIAVAKGELDKTYGVAQASSGWRLPDDESMKTDVLTSWLSNIGILGVALPSMVNETDGVMVEPASTAITRRSDGSQHMESDIQMACHGDVKSAVDGGPQTCRPDGIGLMLGEEPPEDSSTAFPLEFQTHAEPNTEITVTRQGGGSETLDMPEIGKLLAQLLSTVFEETMTTGYATYTGTTHLCNAFKGKANSAVVWGTILETNADYLPSGVDQLAFKFYSTSLEIDDSQVSGAEAEIDCDDEEYKDVLETNLFALITNDGTEPFELNIIQSDEPGDGCNNDTTTGRYTGRCIPMSEFELDPGKYTQLIEGGADCVTKKGDDYVCVEGTSGTSTLTINETDLQTLADRIAGHELNSVPGDTRTVSITANINGSSVTAKAETNQKDTEGESEGFLKDLDSRSGGGGGLGSGSLGGSDTSGGGGSLGGGGETYEDTAEKAMDELGKSSSSLTKSGSSSSVSDGKSLGLTSSSICKLVGMKNWMESGDYEMGYLALCGIARINGGSDANWICSMAGLYGAMQGGSTQSMAAALNGLIAHAGYGGDGGAGFMMITPNMIEQAMRSGNLEDVLMAASAQARLGGNGELAGFLSGAAQSMYHMEKGDKTALIGAVAGMMGDSETAMYLHSIQALDSALESGDTDALMDSISHIAGGMGYSGYGQLSGIVSSVKNAANIGVGMDGAMEACMDDAENWDWLCVAPGIGKMVCGSYGQCTFDYALPPLFEPELLCNDLVSSMGFQLDCTCIYECPSAPYWAQDTRSWGMNMNYLRATLDSGQYESMFAGVGSLATLAGGDYSSYMNMCRMDP